MLLSLRIALLFFVGLIVFPAHAQEKYWQQQLQYRIDVKLNDVEHTLDGFLELEYVNNSPDTLKFIWFHLWPNAFKNDKTAFSDQQVENGNTSFYFSNKEQRGYINRLDFRVNDISAKTEDHPNYIDIVKVILPEPLPPNQSTKITTPFHVQLPYNFSRGGHDGQSYQITQWYPKPAVYDRNGWHPMPYLDQGEFYSEFGNYEVRITLPANYIVAATGELQSEKMDSIEIKPAVAEPAKPAEVQAPPAKTDNKKSKKQKTSSKSQQKKSTAGKKPVNKKTKIPVNKPIASSPNLKTIVYKQERVHDFAWFADKSFITQKDSLQLPSGRVIQVASYYTPAQADYWKNSIRYIKQAVSYYSGKIGEYPYNTVSAVQGRQGFAGGMEYPTITILSPLNSDVGVEGTILHEVGHNWFYGVLASNERAHAWMDEGINSYYENRFQAKSKIEDPKQKMPSDFEKMVVETLASIHMDQPIETPADKFHMINYAMMSYGKTRMWMQNLENYLGRDTIDSCMREYYRRWQFKHPQPEDFKAVVADVSGKNLDSVFNQLNTTGSIDQPIKKKLKVEPFFNFNKTDQYNYLFVSPILGLNLYDGIMLGAAIHNYNLPLNRFRFVAVPMYAFRSKQVNGIGRVSYNWFPRKTFQNIELALAGSHFTQSDFTDSAGNRLFFGFTKIAPSLRFELKEKNPRNNVMKYFQLKTFYVKEDQLSFRIDTVTHEDIIGKEKSDYTIGQLKFVWDNYRVLYPYKMEMMFETGKGFGRVGFTGNYFFNFVKKGGVNMRIFAGKFFYYGDKTLSKQFETERFHLNLSGPKGDEDYTYSNYFFGRNKFEGLASQQIMMRDGFFKVRSDYLSSKIGKTDNWLTAMNLTLDVPDKYNLLNILPIKIPLKIFADAGTYAEAWDKDAEGPRFVYDMGLQFSFLKDIVNIYVPIIYSKVYSDYFKSTPGNNFWQRISFSIDIQNISPRKWIIRSIN